MPYTLSAEAAATLTTQTENCNGYACTAFVPHSQTGYLRQTQSPGATPSDGLARDLVILRLRRHRHRRGPVGHVPAVSSARTGDAGTGVRSRHQRRRHLVLEPLSRRALRFRELSLWLFVLQGTPRGMGMVRAFLPASLKRSAIAITL